MSRASRRARAWRRCWRPVNDPSGIPMMKWHAPGALIRRGQRFQRQSGWYGRRDRWHWTDTGRLTRDVRPLTIDGHEYHRRAGAR